MLMVGRIKALVVRSVIIPTLIISVVIPTLVLTITAIIPLWLLLTNLTHFYN
jgi:hypothetical protein